MKRRLTEVRFPVGSLNELTPKQWARVRDADRVVIDGNLVVKDRYGTAPRRVDVRELVA